MLTEASFWPRLGLILALLAAPAAIGPAATTGKQREPPRDQQKNTAVQEVHPCNNCFFRLLFPFSL